MYSFSFYYKELLKLLISLQNKSLLFMVKKLLVLITLFYLTNNFCQTKNATIVVNARAQKDKILVRWAINNPIEWQRAHKKGFVVNRFTIKRDGKVLDVPEKVILTPKPLVPAKLEKWMEIIQKDNNAAIIAQSIYGESFSVTDAKEGKISKILNIANELDQRYTFALYAADMNFEASQLAGWGLVDSNIKPNEIYAYQVTVFQTPKVQNASYVVGLKDFEPLPIISDFSAIPDDKKVMLSWDYDTYKSIYSSFMIEKSYDGVDFSPISKTNLVNLNSNSNKPSKTMFYGDTIASNDKTYYYRLFGISPFGEKGQVTKPISIKGITSLEAAPRIANYQIQKDNSADIFWEYDAAAEVNIESFEVLVADKDNGKYKIAAEKLAPSIRKINYKNLEPSNYFKVAVIGRNNKRLTSLSMLVQPIDSIAPRIPYGLEGKIDSLGIVKLKWQPNLEKDLIGYRILRANNDKEEFVDIYNKPFNRTEFKDKVSLTMSNKYVYYRLVSEDIRHNMSKPSEILVLEKPDRIAPAAPIFKDYDSKNGKVSLNWIRSYSDDINYYSLKRRVKDQDKWEELLQVYDTIKHEYVDNNVEKNKVYQYSIQAKDKSGLWSSTENSIITVQVQDFTPTKIITDLLGVVDRENKKITLTWAYKNKEKDNVLGASIYKNTVGQPPTLWRELPSKVTALVDNNLKINSEYEYHINLTLKSNLPAKAESIIVKY